MFYSVSVMRKGFTALTSSTVLLSAILYSVQYTVQHLHLFTAVMCSSTSLKCVNNASSLYDVHCSEQYNKSLQCAVPTVYRAMVEDIVDLLLFEML